MSEGSFCALKDRLSGNRQAKSCGPQDKAQEAMPETVWPVLHRVRIHHAGANWHRPCCSRWPDSLTGKTSPMGPLHKNAARENPPSNGFALLSGNRE